VTHPTKHLAQLNVATALDDLDSDQLKGFMGALDVVNAVADRAPGFVWRLQGEDGANATDVKVAEDPRFIVNLSVWESPETLEDFVWNTIHAKIYAKKQSWFEAAAQQHLVMWWVEPGHEPSPEEAMEHLEHLQEHGPTDQAFGWESLPGVRLWQTKRCG
jgi:hypothetical protein